MTQPDQLLAAARDVLRSESASIAAVADQLDDAIARAIALIYEKTSNSAPANLQAHPGAVVISGLGKSGLVGQRISASFASTGTASHFLHPVEALHGDLGRVRRNDVALLLSYSGETDEVLTLLEFLKRQQIPVISITSSRASTLGKLSDIAIQLGRIEEVCPLGLAPTTTVNCISVIGDALVHGTMSLRNFSREDYAAFHPGGSLGRRMLKVHQIMDFRLGENFTPLPETLTLRQILDHDSPTGRRAGAVVLINQQGQLSGVFTDGDLRRHLKKNPNLLDTAIHTVMTQNPKHIHHEALASEAAAIFNQYRIDELPVINDQKQPVGLIDVQDIIRLRIVE